MLSAFSIISGLPPATQKLLALLFGTWFRIVNHSEYNTMSSEAMAKSVAGSLFHTCNDDPHKVEKAVQVGAVIVYQTLPISLLKRNGSIPIYIYILYNI